jgi:hypothetical protein
MVVVLECLRNWREVQTLEPPYLDNIVLQSPLLCLERYDVVDVFEKACDGVCLRAVRVWHIPENVRSRKAVALYCEPQAHVGRVQSREVALSSSLLASSSGFAGELLAALPARANDRPLATSAAEEVRTSRFLQPS